MSEQLTIEIEDEIPPIRREKTASKYDPVLDKAREIAPKTSVVKAEDRDKATSIAAYLRRITDDDEFDVQQRLEKVYVQYLK